MRRLRERFPNELVVIGVHSAKFPAEQLTDNIRAAVLRHGIEHPVVNDADFSIWQSYAVRGWPSIVGVDPRGYVFGTKAGEILADDFVPLIEDLIAEWDRHGAIDRRPLEPQPEVAGEPDTLLRYPAKLLVAGDRLFVADTGHHRVIELVLDARGTGGTVVRVFGNGVPALRDGPAGEASFHGPHGLALDGTTLYVADTDNHAIRAIDLPSGTVRTVAGTGHKAHGSIPLVAPTETPLRSPWAVLARGGLVFIAMAGSHQLWVLVNEQQLVPWAGTGYEALVDGPHARAGFNQPSDLALAGAYLFVADAEASAIRAVSLQPEGGVTTLVGQGLFSWGDVDGTAADVRLQHPTGIAYGDRMLFIADSYNHKIKRFDLAAGRAETLIGSGQAGHADGAFAGATLFEPEGLAVADGRLYIADTNNHLVRVADLTTGTLSTLRLRGLEQLQAPPAPARPAVRLAPLEVAPGPVTVHLEIELPAGCERNRDAPILLRDGETGQTQQFAAVEPVVLALSAEGDREHSLDLTLYYCQTDDQRLCLIHDTRILLPLRVSDAGATEATVTYRVSGAA